MIMDVQKKYSFPTDEVWIEMLRKWILGAKSMIEKGHPIPKCVKIASSPEEVWYNDDWDLTFWKEWDVLHEIVLYQNGDIGQELCMWEYSDSFTWNITMEKCTYLKKSLCNY